jgi:hypothetical protein
VGELANPKVIELRRALIGKGDTAAADDPVELMRAKRWLSDDAYTTAGLYRLAYERAGLCAPGLRLSEWSSLPERSDIIWADLSDAEITALFDAAFRLDPDSEHIAGPSLKVWKRMNASLTRLERQQVFDAVILSYWPAWLCARLGGPHNAASDIEGAAFLSGLEKVQRAITRQQEVAAA